MTTENLVKFVMEVNVQRKMYHDKNFSSIPDFHPIRIISPQRRGGKYIKLMVNQSVWGFIAMTDTILKGSQVRRGDLLKAAGMNSPAKHARGNIVEGTAMYGPHGPSYLK